jgi:hypothetical protein
MSDVLEIRMDCFFLTGLNCDIMPKARRVITIMSDGDLGVPNDKERLETST